MANFAITVTEAELALIATVIDRELKPRRVAAPKVTLEPFHPHTGDARLDAWMRASRDRRGAPKPPRAVPAPAFPYGLKVMDKNQRREAINFANDAVTAWRKLGYEVVVSKIEHSRYEGEVAIDWRNVRVLGAPA